MSADWSGGGEPRVGAASAPGPAPIPPPSGRRQGTRSSRGKRLILAAAIGCVTLGTLVGGVVLGWRLSDYAASSRALPEPSVVTVAPPAEKGLAARTMPDVRGLSEAAARQVIADAGIQPAKLTTSTQPWAGTNGQVIEQFPAFNTAAPEEIRLTVAVEARIPELTGRMASDVARDLSALGAQVEIVHQYKAGATGGSALGIEPKVGAVIPAVVTLTQAESPVSVFLPDVDSLSGDCSRESVPIDGPTYDNSLVCSTSETSESVWLLSRVVDSVSGHIGVPDTADPGTKAVVEVILDGKSLLKATVAYGKPAIPLTLSTTRGLRLTIRITNSSAAPRSTAVGLGDIRLVGGTEAMKQLGEE